MPRCSASLTGALCLCLVIAVLVFSHALNQRYIAMQKSQRLTEFSVELNKLMKGLKDLESRGQTLQKDMASIQGNIYRLTENGDKTSIEKPHNEVATAS